MAKQQDQLGDSNTASIDPDWLHAICWAAGLNEEQMGRLEANLRAIPWADPKAAALRWIQAERAGLHDEEALERYRREHPEEYRNPALLAAERRYRLGLAVWAKQHGRSAPMRMARPRERRPRRVRVAASSRSSRAGPSSDPDPEPEPLASWRGFVAASVRLHAHVLRRAAKAAA